MPVTDRSLVLDGAYFTNLLGDDIVAKSFMPAVAQPGIVEAQIRRLAGFDIYETVILPDNGEKLVGFAAHPSGMAVAMRYLNPVAELRRSGRGHRSRDGPHLRLPALHGDPEQSHLRHRRVPLRVQDGARGWHQAHRAAVGR